MTSPFSFLHRAPPSRFRSNEAIRTPDGHNFDVGDLADNFEPHRCSAYLQEAPQAKRRTPEPQPTFIPTPSSTPVACIGDCDDSRRVSVDELVKGVNIALGSTTLDQYPAFDFDGNGLVSVDELVKGVNAALNGW